MLLLRSKRILRAAEAGPGWVEPSPSVRQTPAHVKPALRRREPPRDPPGAARTLFKETFGHAPTHLVQAPARVELLGGHAEWNDGLALAVAIDRRLCLAAAPRTDGRIELVSGAFPQREVMWLSELSPTPDAPWTAPVKALLRQLRARGVHFGGFNAVVHSEIPPGAGYGSSGALLAATALVVRELYPHKLTEHGAVVRRPGRERMPPPTRLDRLRLAALCRAAAREWAGADAVTLDALTTLCAEDFHAVLTDAQHGTAETHPLIGEIAVVVADTGRLSPIVEAENAALRHYCAAAARRLGVRTLRAVEPAQLKAARDRLTAREHAAAYHVIGENQRVVAAERALREGDLEQFGQYLWQSHASGREFFRNSPPEVDRLIELARAQPGCLGARLAGAGFGGHTVNLVLWNDADDFRTRLETGFKAATGRALRTWRCRIVGGAGTPGASSRRRRG
jgi:galactokinase